MIDKNQTSNHSSLPAWTGKLKDAALPALVVSSLLITPVWADEAQVPATSPTTSQPPQEFTLPDTLPDYGPASSRQAPTPAKTSAPPRQDTPPAEASAPSLQADPSAEASATSPQAAPSAEASAPPLPPAQEELRVGFLPVDDQGGYDQGVNMAKYPLNQANYITDLRAMLNDSAVAALNDKQLQSLFAHPKWMLQSDFASHIFSVDRMVLVNCQDQNWHSAYISNLELNIGESMTAPEHLNPAESMQFFGERTRQGQGSNLCPVVTNEQSSLYHSPQAAHLSNKVRLNPYHDRSLAERDGFTPCPICFPAENSLINMTESERKEAQAANEAVTSKYSISTDPALTLRADQVFKRLIQANNLKNLNLSCKVLDSDEFNSFSTYTGTVYITSGFLKSLESDDEVACMLGHELAHITLKHSQQKKNTNFFGSLLNSALGYVGGYWTRLATSQVSRTINTSFSRGQEYEADEEAIIMAFIAGYDPHELELTLIKLQEASAKGGLSSLTPDFFKNTPDADKRRKAAKSLMKKLDPLEALLKQAPVCNDLGLESTLRHEARLYMEDPQPFKNFLAAYKLLNLPASEHKPIRPDAGTNSREASGQLNAHPETTPSGQTQVSQPLPSPSQPPTTEPSHDPKQSGLWEEVIELP